MGEAIDQFVGAGVAEFAANQALQIGVVGLQTLRALGEFAVFGDEAVAHGLQACPMFTQQGEVARAHRGDPATDRQHHEQGAEDEVEPHPAQENG